MASRTTVLHPTPHTVVTLLAKALLTEAIDASAPPRRRLALQYRLKQKQLLQRQI